MEFHKKHAILLRRVFLILSIAFFSISCEKPTKNSDFSITLDLVIKKDDSIHTYYMTDGTINFNEAKSFWTKVKGNKKNQKIQINFPNKIIPNQFRIDLGNNISQEGIILNKMECAYKSNTLVLKGKEVYKYLRVDESSTVLEKDLGLLQRINPNQVSGPSLYPNGDFLRKKLEELIAAKAE